MSEPSVDVREVERDRHGIMFSGPLEVGSCLRVVAVDDLLSAQAIERLWSHLPLTVFCDCEPDWDDDLQAYVEPDCDCDRKTILAVRNSLAAVLGEAQLTTDPLLERPDGQDGTS